MSHPITRPAAVRWLEWYIPELAGTVIATGVTLALFPFVAWFPPLAGFLLILGQEVYRLGQNGRARVEGRLARARRQRAGKTGEAAA
ncbi:hypothetical protein BAY59_38440 (plasmid) [Prauserella coralliicola]|nr:hypothetical protein BAY59_38440 [Prauserella coralliicola]